MAAEGLACRTLAGGGAGEGLKGAEGRGRGVKGGLVRGGVKLH